MHRRERPIEPGFRLLLCTLGEGNCECRRASIIITTKLTVHSRAVDCREILSGLLTVARLDDPRIAEAGEVEMPSSPLQTSSHALAGRRSITCPSESPSVELEGTTSFDGAREAGEPEMATSREAAREEEAMMPHVQTRTRHSLFRRNSSREVYLASPAPRRARRRPTALFRGHDRVPDRVPDAPRALLKPSSQAVLFTRRESLRLSTALDAASEVVEPSYRGQLAAGAPVQPRQSLRFDVRGPVDPEELIRTARIGAPRLSLSPNSCQSEALLPRVGLEETAKADDASPAGRKAASEADEAKGRESCLFRCRICLEEGSPGDLAAPDQASSLFSPCRCKGTLGLLHRDCLERWLLTTRVNKCEICGYVYVLTPSHRHAHETSGGLRRATLVAIEAARRRASALRTWLASRLTRRHLVTDLVCLAVVTPITYFGVHFCVLGAMSYRQETDNPLAWQVVSLAFLATLLIVMLCAWITLAVRHHWTVYSGMKRAPVICLAKGIGAGAIFLHMNIASTLTNLAFLKWLSLGNHACVLAFTLATKASYLVSAKGDLNALD
ncbi:unnamed protein product [Protopolystoma xenopodis]|uniref:RING-CH-type domain-containing protein n=1 Tax=Protopolystoma xenopodis TaxID=117903 RepID=A0A3S5CHD6_9PLAT|nr:unnamed protein product [Protopolystoma xenopodis]